MLRILKNQGFATIVEVIVTAVIFVVTVFGVLTAISPMRPLSQETFYDQQAYLWGETVYKHISSLVGGSAWLNSSSSLAPGVSHSFNYSDAQLHAYQTSNSWSFIGLERSSSYLLADVPGYPAGEGPRLLTINFIANTNRITYSIP